MEYQDVTGESPTANKQPDPETRSPATTANGDRTEAKRWIRARKKRSTKSLAKPVGSFWAYDGQRCLGEIRDFVTRVEAINLAGRSLGFFQSRSEALRAFRSVR